MRENKCLNVGSDGIYTNRDGSEVKVTKITDEMYFSNRKRGIENSKGCSWLFPNHLEYNGWLACNGLVEVDVEELEGKWS